ncbi:MAG: HD domain-containing phosphohydrolase, partial [Pseudomonadales bacterium]
MTEELAETRAKLHILLLDDEQDILNALKRLLRKDYQLSSFNRGEEALEYLAQHRVDLIVSDMRMPEMDGAEFLTQAREIQPDSVRILLTGYSDMESTVKAINQGGIYTYVAKPWDNQELLLTLSNAAEHITLRRERAQLTEQLSEANAELAEFNQSLEVKIEQRTADLQQSKQQLQQALKMQKALLHDVLDMLSSTIEFRTGFGAGHSRRIALQCKAVAQKLELDSASCQRIYLCALLHEIGKVGLSDEALASKRMEGSQDEQNFVAHPAIGAEIIARVKRFAPLVETIAHQNENLDGSGTPDHLGGEDIPLGSRIIRVVKDFDHLVGGKSNNHKLSIGDAKAWINSRMDIWYDRRVTQALFSLLEHRDQSASDTIYSVGLEGLKSGDTLMEDLVL